MKRLFTIAIGIFSGFLRLIVALFSGIATAIQPLNPFPSLSAVKHMPDRPAVRAFSSLLAKRSSEPIAFAI